MEEGHFMLDPCCWYGAAYWNLFCACILNQTTKPDHQKLLWRFFFILSEIRGKLSFPNLAHFLKQHSTVIQRCPGATLQYIGLNCEYHDFFPVPHCTVGLLSTLDSHEKGGGNARKRRTRFVGGHTNHLAGELAQLGEVLAIGHN